MEKDSPSAQVGNQPAPPLRSESVPLPDHLKPIPVGRHKLPREVQQEHQRARIIEASIPVFAAEGYPATTVDDLVAAAGVGVGSFYAHFEGKEGCLLAACELIYLEIENSFREDASKGTGWAEKVAFGLYGLLRWLADDPIRAKVGLLEAQTAGPAAVDLFSGAQARVAALLRAGRDAGSSPRQLPETLEPTIVNAVSWLLQQRLAGGEVASAPGVFADVCELVLEPYVGEKTARSLAAQALAATGD